MVEDVADDAALIERELRRAGVTGAARRVDSERAYREALRSFAPDIILTDHSLPTFGAADALRIAMLEAPGTPIIVVTGSLGEETAAEYIKAGAADYVVKHHLERLGPAVLRALDLRRAREEQARAEEAQARGGGRLRAPPRPRGGAREERARRRGGRARGKARLAAPSHPPTRPPQAGPPARHPLVRQP